MPGWPPGEAALYGPILKSASTAAAGSTALRRCAAHRHCRPREQVHRRRAGSAPAQISARQRKPSRQGLGSGCLSWRTTEARTRWRQADVHLRNALRTYDRLLPALRPCPVAGDRSGLLRPGARRHPPGVRPDAVTFGHAIRNTHHASRGTHEPRPPHHPALPLPCPTVLVVGDFFLDKYLIIETRWRKPRWRPGWRRTRWSGCAASRAGRHGHEQPAGDGGEGARGRHRG